MVKCSIDLHELKPTILMVLVEIVYSLVNICYKLAANDGMNLSVLVGYRYLFAAAFILPLAFFAERKKRPKLTRKIALYGCLCGLLGGSLGQNLYLKSLVLTSATFVSAMTNLVPAITFVVAISFRLERLGWSSAAGKAKVFGTMVGIGGAMIITFYKGMELNPWNTNINLLKTTVSHYRPHSSLEDQAEHGGTKFVGGAVLGLISVVCYSLWLIVQAKAGEDYPCPYSLTAMMTVAASIQSVAFALCIEKDMSQWDLGWDVRLFTVAVAGILGSGLMFSFVAWCVRVRGPLFVSVFQPLMLVIVAVAGSLFLEEKLHLGMVIGAILIVIGLYIVLWGKGKEIRNSSELMQENMENEARIGMPPPRQQYASSRSEEGEIEVAVGVDTLPAPSSQNSENRVDEEIKVEVVKEEASDMPPHNVSQSRAEEETREKGEGQIDLEAAQFSRSETEAVEKIHTTSPVQDDCREEVEAHPVVKVD